MNRITALIGWLYAASCGTLLGLASDTSSPTPRINMVIVVGAGGTQEYTEQFAAWAEQWSAIGERVGARVTTIGIDAGEDAQQVQDAQEVQDAQRLQEVIATLQPSQAASNQPHWLILIGHGTFQNNVAKFNLHGPDVTADQLAHWLAAIKQPLVIVNTASASGPFVNALSGENRIVVTATKSGSEQNWARFGGYLPKALADAASDLDHDDEVSLLEAVLKAASDTGEFYSSEGRIRTEHAILDDNGDRLGTPAEMLGAVLETTAGVDPKNSSATASAAASASQQDGDVAAKTILIPATDVAALSNEEVIARARIEAELLSLRKKKGSLAEDEYFGQLEKWMRKLAALYRAAEKRANSSASSP